MAFRSWRVGFPDPPHKAWKYKQICGCVPLTPARAHWAKRRSATQLQSRMELQLYRMVRWQQSRICGGSRPQNPLKRSQWFHVRPGFTTRNFHLISFWMKMLGQVLSKTVAEGGAWAACDTAEEAWLITKTLRSQRHIVSARWRQWWWDDGGMGRKERSGEKSQSCDAKLVLTSFLNLSECKQKHHEEKGLRFPAAVSNREPGRAASLQQCLKGETDPLEGKTADSWPCLYQTRHH